MPVRNQNLIEKYSGHLRQLNNRLPKNNKTGHKNISITFRNGKKKYRVSIQYNKKQHSVLRDTLDEAIVVREELRKQYWPNYKEKKNKEKNMIPIHKIENWRDSRGSGLDRARAIIVSTSNDLQEISNKTGIPYQSLKNLRSNPEKISKMSWERTNKLSQLYDIYEIQNNMPMDKANKLIDDKRNV